MVTIGELHAWTRLKKHRWGGPRFWWWGPRFWPTRGTDVRNTWRLMHLSLLWLDSLWSLLSSVELACRQRAYCTMSPACLVRRYSRAWRLSFFKRGAARCGLFTKSNLCADELRKQQEAASFFDFFWYPILYKKYEKYFIYRLVRSLNFKKEWMWMWIFMNFLIHEWPTQGAY